MNGDGVIAMLVLLAVSGFLKFWFSSRGGWLCSLNLSLYDHSVLCSFLLLSIRAPDL